MHHQKIKQLFFEHYEKLGHKRILDSSLIPKEHDPSVLFTNSGMMPLKPYFLGIQKPPAKRLYNIQRCIRTGDIDDVGEDSRHLTFMFMLGNWSIGDYWKEEAAQWAYDLLVKKYKMNLKRLWVSIYKGNQKLGIPPDKEMSEIWEKIGIPKTRHVFLGDEDNFWSAGPTGLCGPTSEIHYDRGAKYGCGRRNCKPGCDCDRWYEIWNPLVQIQYNKTADGKLIPLKIRSIDGGAGLERIACILQGVDDVYMTTALKPLISQIEQFSGKTYARNKKAMRIVADHIQAAVFIIAEGVEPAKKDRGYVLRRILRRMIRYANPLGLEINDIIKLSEFVINNYKKEYKFLTTSRSRIQQVIKNEYSKFIKTLNKGNRLLERLMSQLKTKTIPGVGVFHLYDTFGFPMELTRELAAEKGFKIDERGYYKQFEKHREISKKGLTRKFVSGLADYSKQVIKYHTATHLLHAALRKVLGPTAKQCGSNITPERLRFDFTWPNKLTEKQKKEVEALVNKWISNHLSVRCEVMSPSAAKKAGAIALFDTKYGDKVLVYTIGRATAWVSKEICTGPHVQNTGELGHFRIIKEKSSAAGVRRIKAILE